MHDYRNAKKKYCEVYRFEQNLLESGSLTPINYVKCRHVPRLDTDDDAGPAADFDDKIRLVLNNLT